MRKRGRTDAKHAEIRDGLRAAACTVADTSAVGGGYPDLTVGRANVTYLLEVKSEDGKLTPDQLEFIAHWRGGPLSVVRSLEEALRIVGAIRDKHPRLSVADRNTARNV